MFVGTLIRAFLNGVQTIEELERVNLGLTLTADRIEALDAIGFDWRSEEISLTRENTIIFQDRVKALSEN